MLAIVRRDPELRRAVEATLQEQAARARRMIEERRDKVETLAQVLQDRGCVSGYEVIAILTTPRPRASPSELTPHPDNPKTPTL